MTRAITLAKRGEGFVEPNPMVGCVIAREDRVVGEGWHQRFGGDHAEIEALNDAGDAARGATMFVTLEPCCHHGKTPPCADAVIKAGVKRVVVAQRDPFPQVDGGGLQLLERAGVEVEVGLCEKQARVLNAPYLKLIETGKPWIIAKWAMTLDGKIATNSGDSQWISNAASRSIVHQIRGRVDAIMVGSGTVRADDPTLTARPSGPRTATRVILDSSASLSLNSKLIASVDSAPILVVAATDAPRENVKQLMAKGCEVILCDGDTLTSRLDKLMVELGRRRLNNVLVEGGATLLGTLQDANMLDELHVFIAPKIVGGADAPGPVGGAGLDRLVDARRLMNWTVREVDGDVYVTCRIDR
ncbi:MAG: bifunctional diaminohydroxyphosphoribosylaminopyrimidine deaminase/5-amino-6-(5-phosphoribosylamino)uracil reductase RibD [Planctomycetaceae bacterium]|nr:bifunctional diaminohydroxyphosphoribosylaminopyrimidine deaminase/5-amino-6-(5-phosphoribosylamino)uracil reductase RibD [Planctomycetales bacterium]MCB9926691.1 bifunctional diaminohydroxyphosphoribosylaminopyrimidine deaminase/5-amino-6-(5-phosphoribosylamino)uracil reductase RibD [Planctomycetaceae bacterium]